MGATENTILVLNGGSSSIKFSIFEGSAWLTKILAGKISGIGAIESFFSIDSESVGAASSEACLSKPIAVKNFQDASSFLTNWVEHFYRDKTLVGIGHRIVHGGNHYFAPTEITIELLNELRGLSPLDPDHLPQAILLVENIGKRFPVTPQIACFDTAFHRDMPAIAQLLPIPRAYIEAGLRRYGFHGLSCEYLLQELRELAGEDAANGKIIIAHLGSGASVTAVANGRSVDTSMGLTPCSGLPMSSRSGDLDPGLVLQLAQTQQMDVQAFHRMVNHDSGLKGISGTTGNISELLTREKHDSRAAEAVNYFCYQTRKWICALASTIGGVDTLIFSGGIGENLAEIRARICVNLEFIGISLDAGNNRSNNPIISTPDSQVTLRVIKTDEEIVIARQIANFLDQLGSRP